jgi:hypothetical protein
MDITSPRVLKLKGLLFVVLGGSAGTLLLLPAFSWQALGLLVLTVWAFCRAYYFGFYVLQHYADPSYRYAGILSLVEYLVTGRSRGASRRAGEEEDRI